MRTSRGKRSAAFGLRGLTLGLALGLGSVSLIAPSPIAVVDQALAETPEERAQRMRELADKRREEQEAQRAKRAEGAIAAYQELAEAYLNNDLDKVQAMSREARSKSALLDRDQKANLRHMLKMAPEYRPKWWKSTKKLENNSFKAEIWGRKFTANYVPDSDQLGVQVVIPVTEYNRRTGQTEIVDLQIIVSWKPLMVDTPDKAKGALAVQHGYTLGDMAEIIVWHELGHNYITENVPIKANIELYTNYERLYAALHEYYADMTALYHSTPRARRVVLQFRLEGLDYYKKDQEHRRGAHAIGSIVLADMMSNPDKWPNVHFPPEVPKQQVELNTIIYVYENLAREGWSVGEDIRLQQLAEEYILKHGEKTFKRKGEITLPNKLTYRMLYSDDREHQLKRDQWVAAKLSELRDAGRLDTLEQAGGKYNPPERKHDKPRSSGGGITIVDGKVVRDENAGPPRIEVPWDY